MHSLPRIASQSISNNNNSQDETLSKRKFHLGQNVMYQIHKQALSEYLKTGMIDQKIVQLNLLKMSKLNTQELSILQDVYQQPASTRDKQQAKQILSKIKTQRNPKSISQNEKNCNELSQEEIEFLSVEEYLKQCLRSKINTSKVFNGTYLVDPTINDLKRKGLTGRTQLQYLLNLEPKKRIQKKISVLQRQSSILNPQYCKKPSIQSMEVEDVTEFMSFKMLESKANIEQLIDRFKQPVLTQEETNFFQLVYNCDCQALFKLFQERSFDKSVLNIMDQKGLYPIHIAIKKQNPQLFRLLLNNGARMDVQTKNGKTVQQLCELYQNQEIQEILERRIRRK